jgi:hypothetical protein
MVFPLKISKYFLWHFIKYFVKFLLQLIEEEESKKQNKDKVIA